MGDEPTAFDTIWGQDTAIATLRNALSHGRVHHAYRFEGPPGVGKELAATALAQTLLCETQTGCQNCSACRRVVKIASDAPHVPLHPDVIVVARGLYSGSVLSSKEATGISVEQVRRVVLSRVGFPPHEGRALVIVIRDAEELTVSAANALLKTLEEPHAGVHFVLLSSRPSRLLDTIRSRTLAVRFAPLSEATLRRILKQQGLSEELAPFAQGNAELALQLAEGDEHKELETFANAVEHAVAAKSLVEALNFAGELPRDRRSLEGRLSNYAQLLALKNRELVHSDPTQALAMTRRYQAVQDALLALERNAAPALVFETMISDMR